MVHHRILIVANQTLGGEELTEALRERVSAGATELWIVVPATRTPPESAHPALVIPGPNAGIGVLIPSLFDGSADSAAYEQAERRLRGAQERFGDLGIQVGGEVGDEDPFRAVGDVLSRREFDEVIVSARPIGVSHWLHIDLPGRVHRKHHIPVTTVTARVRQDA